MFCLLRSRHVDCLLKHVFDRNGMIKCINLQRAPEYVAQAKKGVHILAIDEKGRIIPGKDCPIGLVEKFKDFEANPPIRTRAKYVPVNLPADIGGRPPNGSGNPKGRKGRKNRRKNKPISSQPGTQREAG